MLFRSGFDISPEAISYAIAHYPAARFSVGSANAFPAPDNSVDLVTAFEVIEHLAAWQDLLEEAHRVLKEEGVLLVSTPNKTYDSETRAEAGPEFEWEGFQEALARVFPFVRILAQNQQECIVFTGEQAAQSGLSFTVGAPDLRTAHIFVAVCARQPVEIPSFAYVPNLLREREHYKQWLNSELDDARDELSRMRTELSLTRVERSIARAEVEHLKQERNLLKASRWIRLGHKFNVGPLID